MSNRSKYFTGFSEFNCNRDIWEGIFRFKKGNGSCNQNMQALLLMTNIEYGYGQYSHKKSGTETWSDVDSERFLELSSNAESYKKNWLDKWEPPENTLVTFEKFIKDVPEQPEQSISIVFFATAKQVRDYLRKIVDRCGNEHDLTVIKEWTAAGIYSLVALFLQNGSASPSFYCPPPEWDPLRKEKTENENAAIILPADMTMHSPEEDAAEPCDAESSPVMDNETETSQESDGVPQPCCRNCGGEASFSRCDFMHRWQCIAVGFCRACGWLFVIILILSILMAPTAHFARAFPTFARWIADLAKHIFPHFSAGFSNVSDILNALGVSGFFSAYILFAVAGRLHQYNESVASQERKIGYRRIDCKCDKCGAKYKQEVKLDQLSVTETISPRLIFACMIVAIPVFSYAVGCILVNALTQTWYPVIPALSVLLVVTFMKNVINNTLHVLLEQIPPFRIFADNMEKRLFAFFRKRAKKTTEEESASERK